MQQVLARSSDPQVATASLNLVPSIMAELGLHACQPRAYKVTTLRDQQAAPTTITDHVQRDFNAEVPGAKLVGDITYIPTCQAWLYLATVIDCHSKAVVGWSPSSMWTCPKGPLSLRPRNARQIHSPACRPFDPMVASTLMGAD